MRLATTRAALNYWMSLFYSAGNKPHDPVPARWPERSAIVPTECATILSDMFVLDISEIEPVYRFAGTRLCALFGQELRGKPFADLYRTADQNVVAGWADQLHYERCMVLLCSRAANAAGETVTAETLLMPLANNGRSHERLLGITVPSASPYWLGNTPVDNLTLLTARSQLPWRDSTTSSADPSRMQQLHAVRAHPAMRKVRHLGVLEGGLSGAEKALSP